VKTRIAPLVAGVALLTLATPGPSAAATRALPRLPLDVGSRSVTSLPAIAMSAHLGDTQLRGSMSVVVTETTRTGTSPWSITASVSTLTDATAHTLAAANIAVSNRSAFRTLGGGTVTAPGAATTFGSPITWFTNTGQSSAILYTGTYTGSADLALSLPNATPVGVYTGTLTVTLLQ
jgi:hypothetical protein